MRWDFALDESGKRLEKLRAAPPFESVLKEIQRRSILCCHEDSIRGTPFRRIAYSIDAGEDFFDLFFNSWNGYRASFYRGPFEGLRANRLCLDMLESTLVNAPCALNIGLPNGFLKESLRTGSAKIWLAEHGKETVPECVGCKGEWRAHGAKQPEILNGRWEVTEHYKAKWGRQAPRLTKLRVFGAFLDEPGNEFIPRDKQFRAEEIFAYGWS